MYLDIEGGITGIMYCYQTGGPTSGWAYKLRAYKPVIL